MTQSNLEKIKAEFGARACTLFGGGVGLRGGLTCTVKDVDGADPVMDFIGSTGQVDRYNEQIDQTGWDLTAFRANPVIPDCHNYDSVARILGRADSIEVKDGALVNRVRFCLDNPLGAMAYKMAKSGFIKSQSVGFIPLEWVNGKAASDPDRIYKKAELLEVSLVVVPANAGATVGLALKSGAISQQDIRETLDMLKEFCGDNNQKPGAKGCVSDSGAYDAQLLQEAAHHSRTFNAVARSLEGVLRK